MSAHQAPPLAYLVSRYPAISHTFILREIEGLRALGHRIHTASVNPPDRSREAMGQLEQHESDHTYCLKTEGIGGALGAIAWWLPRHPLRLLQTLLEGWRLWRGPRGLAYAAEAAMVARWMRRQGLQHLHVHFGNAGASVGLLTKSLASCHLSYTIHGPDEFDDVPGQQLERKLQIADLVVCVSQFARSQLMRISTPQDWGKLRVCRLGVDPACFNFHERNEARQRLRLLCVGRLAPAKGQLLLVQACAQLRHAGVDFELDLVGTGPDRVRLETAVAGHGLGDRIHLRGALNQEGVRQAMDAADIFVLPSLAEGIPVVLMEAMASGLPCISTPVNGIPELIVQGENGLLAVPGDVDSLVHEIRRLAMDPGLRSRLARAARASIASQYDLSRNVGALSKLFSCLPPVPMAVARPDPKGPLSWTSQY